MSVDRSYQETVNYLFALQKHGVKLGLENSNTLMEIMGSPHRKIRTVHVGGTNGKGSTAICIASILQAAGYRVGLYTSPHLVSFTERIRINGVAISESDVVTLARTVRDAYRSLKRHDASGEISPTFFEVTTAIAFRYFADHAVDIAVIEVGMGGRLDSTNVIRPLVSVITNIDLEHTEFLGTTIEQIAGEKAGIIKPEVPLVTGARQPGVIELFERDAAAKGAVVYRLQRHFWPENCVREASQVFDYRGLTSVYRGLRLHLIGRHQVDNACLALAAIECLGNTGIVVDESALRSGLEQARWEGRMELVARQPDTFLDGAHNPASARALAGTIRELKPSYRRLVLIIGILGDKDYHGILAELLPLADHVVVTMPQYSRALDIGLLAKEVQMLHASVDVAGTVGEAIERSREKASADDLVLVTGSLYVVGDARALFLPDRGRTGTLTSLKG
jgi:dihydrofolate synthase/folylpolyglutamate synthase